MGGIGQRGWSGRMRDISPFVTLIFPFFVSSPRLQVATVDRFWRSTIYTSQCAVPRKEVSFGGLDDNPKCLGGEIPPKKFLGRNRHFKPNFRKLKSQYLRKYNSDRHKILNASVVVTHLTIVEPPCNWNVQIGRVRPPGFSYTVLLTIWETSLTSVTFT